MEEEKKRTREKLCKNFRCKKPIPDGTKKCPHCGWEQEGREKK